MCRAQQKVLRDTGGQPYSESCPNSAEDGERSHPFPIQAQRTDKHTHELMSADTKTYQKEQRSVFNFIVRHKYHGRTFTQQTLI